MKELLKTLSNGQWELLSKATWEHAPHIKPADCVCNNPYNDGKHHWTCVDKNLPKIKPTLSPRLYKDILEANNILDRAGVKGSFRLTGSGTPDWDFEYHENQAPEVEKAHDLLRPHLQNHPYVHEDIDTPDGDRNTYGGVSEHSQLDYFGGLPAKYENYQATPVRGTPNDTEYQVHLNGEDVGYAQVDHKTGDVGGSVDWDAHPDVADYVKDFHNMHSPHKVT
mgnify:CR=1 FL=1|jgi:hypothetical protein